MNAPMKFSVLSTRAANTDQQIRLGGKIRAGVKVLTKAAQNNPKAVSIYIDGVEKREKFTDIEKRIKDATGIANPMFPRNTPYFNVAASDFGMPEIAALIVQTYGEIRSDHSPKMQLFRFPVVFHSDDLNDVYPNSFKRHGAEPHYESHYGEDGERYCRYLPSVSDAQAAEIRARRIKKVPRREKVIRGRCDPGTCHEFGQGQCKFRGRLLFYVPGIPTTGMLGMETSSEYAAEGIWSDLERIRNALGTIPRCNPNKPGAPIFWITKSLEQRTYFDEQGKKQVGFQWVPKLQADIDIGALLSSGKVMALPSAQTPVAWLSQPKGMPQAVLLPGAEATPVQSEEQGNAQQAAVDVNDQLEQMAQAMELDQDLVMKYFDIKIAESWENDPAHVETATKMLKQLERLGNACAGKLIGLSVRVAQIGISTADFNAYALARYGKGFTTKFDLLTQIEAEVEDLAKQPREDAIAHVKRINHTAQTT